MGQGVTSLAGPLSAIAYNSYTKKVYYLDAGFNNVLVHSGYWNPLVPRPGATALVPGAIAGLEALSEKFGKLTFSSVLQPAIDIARNGFVLDDWWANYLIASHTSLLKRSEYGRKTFFRNGEPLREGDILRAPEVGEFLKNVSIEGSSYVYKGKWAKKCVDVVTKNGGKLSLLDFSSYSIRWLEPLKISYREHKIYAPSGMSCSSPVILLALKVLERDNIKIYGKHFSNSADALELIIKLFDIVESDFWLYNDHRVNFSFLLNEELIKKCTKNLWRKLHRKLSRVFSTRPSNHSYHIIVVDSVGNVVTGTNTIESLPWGKGIFVEGIPLTSSGELYFFNTKPGERRLNPCFMSLGFKKNNFKFATGAFGASLEPASFQLILNLVDYNLPVRDVVELPRFGTYSFDDKTLKITEKGRWLDRRVDPSIVDELKKRGISFDQTNYVDTGFAVVAISQENGEVEGGMYPTL